MTAEELEKLITDQAAKIEELSTLATKVGEIDSRLNPAPADPDLEYKPKTWKDLHESQEQVAMRVLEQAEARKEEIRRKEDEEVQKQNRLIEDTLSKLQEEGLIKESKDKDDEGGRQRAQILGMTLRSRGSDVEAVARSLRTAWDNGLEYDYQTNSFVKVGKAADTARLAPVTSSAARVAPVQKGGPINLKGVGGDLGTARERWLEANR